MDESHKPNEEEGILEVLENVDKDDDGKFVAQSSNTNIAISGTIALSESGTTYGTLLKRTDDDVEADARGKVNTSIATEDTEVHHGTMSLENTKRVVVRHVDAMNIKKRLCRFPGCERVIKSQGHCQRHGARAKRCRIPGCDKQAQGTHDGMCKRHWKQMHSPFQEDLEGDDPKDLKRKAPPPPVGESVYEHIMPNSIAFRPSNVLASAVAAASPGGVMPLVKLNGSTESSASLHMDSTHAISTDDPDDSQPQVPDGSNANVMPLVQYLHMNASLPAGWHRHHERRAKGVHPVTSITAQLEPWERQLALLEILLLSGGTPYANFKDLSHAWGREKGFHMILANSVCERHGEVDRKRRSDAGRITGKDAKRLHVSSETSPGASDVVAMNPKDMADEEDDDDSSPGDAVTAMCNDEGAIGMMLLEELPTTHTNGDNMAYGITQV